MVNAASLSKIYEDPHASLFPFYLFAEPWSALLEDKAGTNMLSNAIVFREGGVEWFTEKREQEQIANELLKRMLHQGFFEVVDSKTRFLLAQMIEFTKKFREMNFQDLTDGELADFYEEYCQRVVELNSWGTLVTLMEMGEKSVVTDAVLDYLNRAGREKGLLEEALNCVSLLCSPVEKDFLWQKKREEIEAAILAKNHGFDSSIVKKAIDELAEKYCWVAYGYSGPALARSFFEQEIKDLTAQNDLLELRANFLEELEELKKKQGEIEEKLGCGEFGKRLLRLARTFAFQKEYRKQVLYYSFYSLAGFKKEAAKRLEVGVNQVNWLFPNELRAGLEGKELPDINSRMRLCIYAPFEQQLLTGKEADDFLAIIPAKKIDLEQKTLQGQGTFLADPIVGVARIIFSSHDLKKLKDREIIVSPATSPSMVSGMNRASAIVTDQGGLTCHAAVVSRELRKPCVIGTKIATQVIKDGEKIEVNSRTGTIIRLGVD